MIELALLGAALTALGVWLSVDARRPADGRAARPAFLEALGARRQRIVGTALATVGALIVVVSIGVLAWLFSLFGGIGQASAGSTVTLQARVHSGEVAPGSSVETATVVTHVLRFLGFSF